MKSKKFNKKRNVNLKEKDIVFTNHFCDRWTERTGDDYETLENFKNVMTDKVKGLTLVHVSGKYYLLNDFLVVCVCKKDEVTFITTYGHIDNCYMIYDFISTKGAIEFKKFVSRYGKIDTGFCAVPNFKYERTEGASLC